MRKNLICAASLAAMVLAGCTQDEYFLGGDEAQSSSGEISFAMKSEALTRADVTTEGKDAADSLGNNFVVVGYKTASTSLLVFDHYNVNYKEGSSSESNKKGWEYVGQSMYVRGAAKRYGVTYQTDVKYGELATNSTSQTIKYWDYSATKYQFFAFSVGNGVHGTALSDTTYAEPSQTTKTPNAFEDYAYKFTGSAEALGRLYVSDVVTAVPSNASGSQINYGDEVKLTFRHISPKVRVALYETVPGYSVQNVKFYTSTSSKQAEANLYASAAYFYPDGGTYYAVTLTNSTTTVTPKLQDGGTQKNDQSFGKLTKKVGAEALGETDNIAEKSLDATSTSGSSSVTSYITAFQTDGSQPLTLKVDFTLVSMDSNGEKIQVTGATAVVPAEYTKWQQGHAYTYIFKISNKTNGTTGNGDPQKGLTAITFDAVTVDNVEIATETDESGTKTASITTYVTTTSNGTTIYNASEQDKVPADATIYASVYEPGTTCCDANDGTNKAASAGTVAPTAVYAVTVDNKPASATEEDIIDAWKKVTTTSGVNTYSVTYNNATYIFTNINATAADEVPKFGTAKTKTNPVAPANLSWKAIAGYTYLIDYTCSGSSKQHTASRVMKVAGTASEISFNVPTSASSSSAEVSITGTGDGVTVVSTLYSITVTTDSGDNLADLTFAEAVAATASSSSNYTATQTPESTTGTSTLTLSSGISAGTYIVKFTVTQNGNTYDYYKLFTVAAV